MPREIVVIPEFTRMRQQEQLFRDEAIASIPQSISQALMTYANLKDQQEKERISIYDHMLSTYKDRMPQDAMVDYNRMLTRRYGVGLPKDPATGEFMTPSPTVDEMVAREIRGDPKLLQDAVQKQISGKSALEVKWHDEEVATKQAFQNRMLEESRMRTEITKARALEAAAKQGRGDQPGNIVQLPDGRLDYAASQFNSETGQWKVPGTVMLSNDAAKNSVNLYKARVDEGYKQAQEERIKSQVEVDKAKLKNYIAFGPGRAQWDILHNIWSNPKTTDKMREAIKPQIIDLMMHAGVSDENIGLFLQGSKPDSWMDGFIGQFFTAAFGTNGIGPQIEAIQKQIGPNIPPTAEGQRQVTSGKVFTKGGRELEVRQVGGEQDYDTRMRNMGLTQVGPGSMDVAPESASPSPAPQGGSETDFVSPGPSEPVDIPRGTSAKLRARAEQIPDIKTRLKLKSLISKLEEYEVRLNDPNRGLTKPGKFMGSRHAGTEEEARSVLQSINELFAGIR